MPSYSSSAIVANSEPVTHDLAITGYSTTRRLYTNGTYIRSANFVGGGRRWYLRYYPNGCGSRDIGRVTFLLYHDRDTGADEDRVTVLYKVSLLRQDDGNPEPRFQSNHRTTYDDKCETPGLISRTCLEPPAYLRDDAFSVRCEFDVPVIVTKC